MSLPALLVSPANALKSGGGGVQVCTREYQNVLKEAGFALKTVSLDLSISPVERVQRRLFPRIGEREARPHVSKTILHAVEEHDLAFIFYNFDVFVNVLRAVRNAFPSIRQVFLSHGLESTDFRINQQIQREHKSESRVRGRAERMLNRRLAEEGEQRAVLDAVITLSPLEVELEESLGAQQVTWLPGIVTDLPLAHKPVNGRAGCVSTLDHPPNLDGLVRLFEALSTRVPKHFRFRVVGGPNKDGQALATQFRFVDYLGILEDEALRAEAATWSCFAHPLFVNAKGRSTKLGVALGWELPIATTVAGARGYDWIVNRLPLATQPEELADAVIERSNSNSFERFRDEVRSAVAHAPKLDAVAASLREFLSLVRT